MYATLVKEQEVSEFLPRRESESQVARGEAAKLFVICDFWFVYV